VTYDDLVKKGFAKQPDGTWGRASSPAPALAAALPHPVPKSHDGATLVEDSSDEEECSDRVVLRITRRACVLLDFDNGAGGCKALIDALRYAEVVVDDDPQSIDFQFRQERVATRAEEGTLIEIL
jgi:hypothetical protein